MLRCQEGSPNEEVAETEEQPLQTSPKPQQLLKVHFGAARDIGMIPQTDINSCLFILDKVICMLYIDDTLLSQPVDTVKVVVQF